MIQYMSLNIEFTHQTHFGSVFIQGRSGWGKTHMVQRIIENWSHQNKDAVVYLSPDEYTSWLKWKEATITITNGQSVFCRLYGKTETYVIEDIHQSYLWNTSVRLKFLEQVQTIAKHSNIIITMDTFGMKVPKLWSTKTSWNYSFTLTLPSTLERIAFCKNDAILSKLQNSQLTFLLEITQDVSFRSLQRISHFIQQKEEHIPITLTFLRQASLQVGEVYLPPGLFSNAQEFVRNPNIPLQTLEVFYLEDSFHFPYLIWNTLPTLCYHNGISNKQMLYAYQKFLEIIPETMDTSQNRRVVAFQRLYRCFHSGWRVISSVVFQIPNIRNKISYSKVRLKTIQKIVEDSNIPPMFVMERCKEDASISSKMNGAIKNKKLYQ